MIDSWEMKKYKNTNLLSFGGNCIKQGLIQEKNCYKMALNRKVIVHKVVQWKNETIKMSIWNVFNISWIEIYVDDRKKSN